MLTAMTMDSTTGCVAITPGRFHNASISITPGMNRTTFPVTALKKAWDHAVQEVHQETERINASIFDRVKPPKRRGGHER